MAQDRHHRRTISRTDEEWEAMKEPFRKCYIDDNMSLKQATKHLSVNHSFPASERQWERKKEQWGFTKYEKRETRQQFIDDALRRGMTMEDILNAPEIPAEGSGGDDRAVRRNWRRFVKRERDNRSRSRSRQPHSPTEGQRQSFDTSRQDHQIVEKTYDVELPDGIIPDHATGTLPDSIRLEATSAQGSGQSPVQFHVVSEVNPPTAPEIFFSTWDDAAERLQDHGPLHQMTFANNAHTSYQTDYNLIAPPDIDPSATTTMNETYGTYPDYQQVQTAPDYEQPADYGTQEQNTWNEVSEPTAEYNINQQELFDESANVSAGQESFPTIDEIPQVQYDSSFDTQVPLPAMTPRAASRAANDYFQDPLTTDLSNIVDQFTDDVQKVVKEFMAELPKISPKVLQKMIEESLQSRRDLCLRTVSKEIENQARIKQQALDSITQKCRNLERIMAEKGINTRAELKELKARSQPRQITENGALDMSQWNAQMNNFVI